MKVEVEEIMAIVSKEPHNNEVSQIYQNYTFI